MNFLIPALGIKRDKISVALFFPFYHYFNFIDEIQRGVIDGKEKSQLKINFVGFFF